jgi:TonB family protein
MRPTVPHGRARVKNFLVWGIALSVALHLALAPLVHASATPVWEQGPQVVEILSVPTPSPVPRATPTPKPTPPPVVTPTPHEQPSVPRRTRIRITTQTQTANRRGGAVERTNAYATGSPGGLPDSPAIIPTDAGSAPAEASASATPRETASPLACARPDIPPATLRAAEPELPALAQQQGIGGTVDVVVSLDAASNVIDARVQSSPSRLLDAPALAAASASRFRTEVRDCAPVAAKYLFRVEFASE